MDQPFMGVLNRATFLRDNGGLVGETEDYVLVLPYQHVTLPDYVMTDCDDWRDLLVGHLRPYLAQAAQANTDQCSVGLYLAWGEDQAYIGFQQIYVGGVEFPSMLWVKDSQDFAALGQDVKDGLATLVDGFAKATAAALEATHQGPDWLPPDYAAFAKFHDDSTRADWKDTQWFALDPSDEIEAWLAETSMAGRHQWCRHPCNNALVVVFENVADADLFEELWTSEP